MIYRRIGLAVAFRRRMAKLSDTLGYPFLCVSFPMLLPKLRRMFSRWYGLFHELRCPPGFVQVRLVTKHRRKGY